MAELIENHIPVVKYHGLNTAKDVTFTGTNTFSGATTLSGTTVISGPLTATGGYTEGAEVVTATNVITASETGKTFYLSAAGGFLSTLPTAALGLFFNFVVKTAPTSVGYTISSAAGADVIYGMFVERAGGAGVAGAARDLITLVANQSIIGDWFTARSDGTNWYVHGMVDVAAGITFGVT